MTDETKLQQEAEEAALIESHTYRFSEWDYFINGYLTAARKSEEIRAENESLKKEIEELKKQVKEKDAIINILNAPQNNPHIGKI